MESYLFIHIFYAGSSDEDNKNIAAAAYSSNSDRSEEILTSVTFPITNQSEVSEEKKAAIVRSDSEVSVMST